MRIIQLSSRMGSKLRDLQSMPDDQAYLCHDKEIAAKFHLQAPFRCGVRRWMGDGLVQVYFRPALGYETSPGTPFQESDYAFLRDLEPLDGQTWEFQ